MMDKKQQVRQGEISIIDIILYCLEKWRWIVGCMLIAAILMGTYKYQATVRANGINNILEQEQGDELDEENIQGEQATESYEQAIRELERDLEVKEDYLDNSVVMQMDPNHVFVGTLSYYVKDVEKGSGVIAAYNAFVSGGKMAEELVKLDDSVSVEDLQYLILFFNSKNTMYKMDASNQMLYSLETGEPVFQIQLRMPDREHCMLYLKYAEEIMAKYSIQLQSEIGEHNLTLLSSAQFEEADSEIQEYQSTMRTDYATTVKNLQGLRTELATIQEMQSSLSLEGESEVAIDAVNVINPVSAAVKYAILGLGLGAGIVCFILLINYMIGGRLQDTDVFDLEFGMPLLGIVRTSEMKRKLFGFVDTWIFRLRGGVYAKIGFEEQIKMTAVNIQAALSKNTREERTEIMIAGTIPVKDVEILCARLVSELGSISFSSYKQIVFQSSALKELENYDWILFLEKKGVSNSSFIAQEKKLAVDRGVEVLGTVVLC